MVFWGTLLFLLVRHRSFFQSLRNSRFCRFLVMSNSFCLLQIHCLPFSSLEICLYFDLCTSPFFLANLGV